MKLLFLLLFSYCYQANSQSKLDAGKIIAAKDFNCEAYSVVDPLFGISVLEPIYGVDSICSSTNEIEIRLMISYGITQKCEVMFLSYKNGAWSAKRYDIMFGSYFEDSIGNAKSGKVIVSNSYNNKKLDSLFTSLKQNDVFLLPDFKDIKRLPDGPTCGSLYALTFKVGDKIRTYTFNNLQYYLENSKRKIFRKYDQIVTLLSNCCTVVSSN